MKMDVYSLERKRKQVSRGQIAFVIAGIILFSIIAKNMLGMSSEKKALDFIDISLIVGMLISGYFMAKCFKDKKEFYFMFKRSVVEQVLCENFTDYSYEPEGLITPSEIVLVLQCSPSECHGEDLITGIYKGIQYRQSDIKIVTNGDSHTTIADGRMSVFIYPKSSNMSVLIFTRKTKYSVPSGLKAIRLENEEFNDEFFIYANDQHAAFYLLTPQMMEHIRKLGRRCELLIKIENGIMYVFRNGIGGAFEVDFRKKLDVEREKYKAQQDMKDLLGIIDLLKLENE